jgi:O-antigen/teichoic acid export membrane protein
VTTGFLLAGQRSASMIFVSWGVGALAGALVFLFRTRQWPWRGDPRQWVSETRYLSGWFTATQIIGQIQVQAISFLVSGRLSQRDLSGLRGGQTALIQPVQNFIVAVQSLIVPRLSRLAGDAKGRGLPEGQSAAERLRRQTRLLAFAFAGLALVIVVTVVPLSEFVLARLSKFADIAPLALPLCVQAGIYLVELPFAAALRGMHRARLLFLRYVVYTSASLAGLVAGGDTDGLHGAVWGLTAGAAVSLITMIAFYRYALHRLVQAPPDRAEVEPVPSVAT